MTYLAYLIYFGMLLASWSIVRYLYLMRKHRISNYPLGPIGIPIFGSLLFALNPLKFFRSIYKDWGEISMFYFGFRSVILLNSVEASHKILKLKECLQREPLSSSQTQGVGFTNGYQWKTRRELGLKCIKSAIDSNWYRDLIQKSLQNTFKIIDNELQNGECIWYPRQHIHHIGFNAIFAAFFGDIIPFQSNEYHEYSTKLNRLMRWSPMLLVLNMFLKMNIAFPPIENTHKRMKDILFEWVVQYGHYEDIIVNKNSKTLGNDRLPTVDILLIALKNNKITKEELLEDLAQYFSAGSDSNQHTIEYGLKLLCKYSDIQELLYKELTSVYGSTSTTQYHVTKLPLIRAFTQEVLRLSSIAPTGIPRVCTKDITVNLSNGATYNIPADSVIMSNTFAINNDPKYWPKTSNENKINLKNWLDNDGNFKYNNSILTFSVGKRDCLGRSLALKVIHYVFINFILKYQLDFIYNDNKNIDPFQQSFRVVQCLANDIPIKLSKRRTKMFNK